MSEHEVTENTDNNRSFAAKLEHLFTTRLRIDGRRYTQDEVVQGCDGALTRVYLWKLRTGRATNPSMRVVQALADFFSVGVDYFSLSEDDTDTSGPPAVGDPIVRHMAEKFSQLDDRGRRVFLNLLDYVLSLKSESGP
jgi:transcriptional regulator with XRE-family HTH domain